MPRKSGQSACREKVLDCATVMGRTSKPARPRDPGQVVFRVEGTMSTFGGPHDTGVGPNEGLALLSRSDLNDPKYRSLFLPAAPPGTRGLARRLDPQKYYLACRWNYDQTSRSFLRKSVALVKNPRNGRAVCAQPVDWGPNSKTGRVADLSPGLAARLGLNTDDEVIVTISSKGPSRRAPARTDDSAASASKASRQSPKK